MQRIITCLIATAIALAGCASPGATAEPALTGMVEIVPDAGAQLAERPGIWLGIVLEDGSVLTAPSRIWTGEPLRITSLTSDATAAATRVLDWDLARHWVRLEAEWRTGAPVGADLGPAPAPGDALRIYAARRDGAFEFLEPRRLRASTTQAPSLLHSANVVFKEPAAAMGAPVVDEADRIVALVGNVGTSTGASLKLSLVPLEVWHRATIRIAAFPDPWPGAEPIPLADFALILEQRDEVWNLAHTARQALDDADFPRAGRLARNALRRDHRSTDAIAILASARMQTGDWAGAAALARGLIARQARPLLPEAQLATCLLALGDDDEATLIAGRVAARATAGDLPALRLAAETLEEAGAAAEARAAWERILEAEPANADAQEALLRLEGR